MDDIIWMGPQPSVKRIWQPGPACRRPPFARLADCMKTAISGTPDSFFSSLSFQEYAFARRVVGIRPALVKNYASLELIKAVVDLRSVKEPCEIEEITKACNIGYEMHTAAMRNCKPGSQGTIYCRADRRNCSFVRKYGVVPCDPVAER